MEMTLYYGSGSPFAWRVMLALVYKGLDYEAKLLDFGNGDLQAPEFLKLNPRGKIPVLVDGDFVVRESTAILAYLDKAYPEKPIFGTTAFEVGRVYERLLELQHYLGMTFQQFAIPIFMGTVNEKKAEMNEALAKIPTEIALINGWLAEADYIAGDFISAADFTAYPLLALVQRVLSSPVVAKFDHSGILPYASKAPHIAAWMKRIEALPKYDETYPPHWKTAA